MSNKFGKNVKNLLLKILQYYILEPEIIMRLTTFNTFGKISISKLAISKVAAVSVLECVGVVGLVSQRSFFKGNALTTAHKGVVVTNIQNDSMKIDVYVIMKHCGVSASAVASSIKQSVKYSVERFAGMVVKSVVVHIVDVRV